MVRLFLLLKKIYKPLLIFFSFAKIAIITTSIVLARFITIHIFRYFIPAKYIPIVVFTVQTIIACSLCWSIKHGHVDEFTNFPSDMEIISYDNTARSLAWDAHIPYMASSFALSRYLRRSYISDLSDSEYDAFSINLSRASSRFSQIVLPY